MFSFVNEFSTLRLCNKLGIECAGEDTVVSVTGQKSRQISSDMSGDHAIQGMTIEPEDDK